MLKPSGLSVVASDATFAGFTIVQSPIHMVTLSTLTSKCESLPIIIPGNQQKGYCVIRSLCGEYIYFAYISPTIHLTRTAIAPS